MGSFSWMRADRTTKRSNLTMYDPYKILVPKEFGGGYIYDKYYDYGYVNEFGCAYYVDGNGKKYKDIEVVGDLYGFLAYWNMKQTLWLPLKNRLNDSRPTMLQIWIDGNTCDQNIRCMGIDIGCYDKQVDALEYPLKLVSVSYDGTYEDCKDVSYNDPEQGFFKTYWRD